MDKHRRRDESPSGLSDIVEPDGLLGTGITSRHIEAFGRKVTSTAGHLMGPAPDSSAGGHYHTAMADIQRELRHPNTQRKVFSLTQTTPTDLVRSKLSTTEIQSRAISSLPDELLANIPDDSSSYSLFQGFQASQDDIEYRRAHRRRSSKSKKLLKDGETRGALPSAPSDLKKERDLLSRRMELMGVRKNMCSSEIHDIDNKIANLHNMRKIVLDRLAGLEMEEADLEHELNEIENKLEDIQEEQQEAEVPPPATPKSSEANDDSIVSEDPAMGASFMSESIYQKIPSPKSVKQRSIRKRSMPVLHEHFAPGSEIKEMPAHSDMVTAIDFDYPFGTMISAALDDTVRVWDLNVGRCVGFLEGHNASVRCLQIEDNIVATGSMDASVKLWDLSRARTTTRDNRVTRREDDEESAQADDASMASHSTTLEDCYVYSLDAHVDEVTALHFKGDTLISGSADKTLRQWDLVKGRCVQTLDVLWAAAQASTLGSETTWRPSGRLPDASADFVGAVQCFDAALACGTADGMVRLWDLRSGQVHRSLVGHTGPITCLQFDDVHLVTGSQDRSIRIWDLRTGSIFDAYAYDKPITSMMFDTKRIVAAAGENVVKVYDKADGHHWDCGAGVGVDDSGPQPATVERVRLKDGFLVEGRKDGIVAAWTC
ncbi:mitochondrial division protein 1 [Aspergillus awamori]|uniref:Mitochondrial division protein 1 n=3 Tax=Aspergillus TaxID=5052 RepID=A0A3F3QG08_9EURO|nr:mitochondrial division protein 1 [Aspergillus niger CBS 101883]XP_026630884.1 mitochondrial division protein 1 [Aspergillus welwitschiae]GCB19101.1 mitochondrial division protein 1 [Aspergillus awamori]GJP93886.1 mitochondrial division protein 1 [Aspergillus niger]PYH54049.1 mitochondrial division protein 1 [Aspergillus niger CBS 101883]RDH37862.1 mitochondrial division protein 1 [Aspergillus welwitschiae]GKZ52664.1 mitochondrial fission protein [Aspergillus niger]